MAKRVVYPFVPKSTRSLMPGQFWQIGLSNGRFACGRVLQLPGPATPFSRSRTIFLAGLMDWCGDDLPTADGIAGSKLLEQGRTHIVTISRNGAQILGHRSLELDEIAPAPELSQGLPVEGTKLMNGFEIVRDATLEEQQSLYCSSGWGYAVTVVLAECYFVRGKPPPKRLPWTEWMTRLH